jgi:hypothetical protein
MTARSIAAALVLVGLLQSSGLASSVSKAFKGTPEQVFAAAEKALRENSRISTVKPSHKELKIRFEGPSTSGREQYSALSGDASVVPGVGDKCMLTISVNDVHVSSSGGYLESMGPAISTGSEKSFANSVLRRVGRILGQ